MRAAYSSLPNIRVEPLRLAEHDLNATRMLSMMGCDDIDVGQLAWALRSSFLTLHRKCHSTSTAHFHCSEPLAPTGSPTKVCPVLRHRSPYSSEPNPKYTGFKAELRGTRFNSSQRSMLKLRTDVMDAYLWGNAPDLRSWLKGGRLVIVDLTDPFIDGEHGRTCPLW